MCNRCHAMQRRLAAALALAPVLTIAQPIAHGLIEFVRPQGAPPAVTTLSLVDAAWAGEAKASADPTPVKYTCPMHPHYIADVMGTCPICGMDLVKLQTDGGDLSASESEGRAVITVAPETIQTMGVRLGRAEDMTFGRRIRSYGIVNEDERRQTEITARVEGWIEDLKVRAVGDEVKKGDLLFKLYSPQLIVSQNDYLRSRGNRDLAGRGEGQLRAFGVQPEALEKIQSGSQPIELVPFYAQQTGTVSELALREGTYVKRGMMLAKIQDYSSVWLIVSVPEKDLGFISKTTQAAVSFPNLPGREASAKVDYIYPTVDPATRTGRVRLVIDNDDGVIRPGSYADVEFEVGAERRLAVPSESILRSGAGAYIVVSLGEGRFEPRAVKTGLVSAGTTEITSGLKANEDVVVSGQFLLDSESALRESFKKLQRLQVPLSLLQPTKTEFAMIDHVVDAALYIHEALIDGYDLEPKQLEPAIAIRDLMWPRYRNTQLAFVLDDAAAALKVAQSATSESQTKDALATLVKAIRIWIIEGAPKHYASKKVDVYQDAEDGRVWVQLSGKPLNPYARRSGNRVPFKFASDESGAAAAAKETADGK